jgi:hypothetical protein
VDQGIHEAYAGFGNTCWPVLAALLGQYYYRTGLVHKNVASDLYPKSMRAIAIRLHEICHLSMRE